MMSEVDGGLLDCAELVIDDAYRLAIEDAKVIEEDITCLILSASLQGQEYPYSSSLLQKYARSRFIDEARVGTVFIEDLRNASKILEDGRHGLVAIVFVEFVHCEEKKGLEWAIGATAFVVRKSEENHESAVLRFDAKQIRMPSEEKIVDGIAEEAEKSGGELDEKDWNKEKRKKAVSIPMRVRWAQRGLLSGAGKNGLLASAKVANEKAQELEIDENAKRKGKDSTTPPFAEVMRYLLPFCVRLIEDARITPDRVGLVVWNRLEVLRFDELAYELRQNPLRYANGIDHCEPGSSLAANLHEAIKSKKVLRAEGVVLLEVRERNITGAVLIF
ncbi:hypothetical protein [Herbaspirillum robiniae]|uniref:hypothetical protein n=1 Tax=Herbaspirillum robiniae TaxID=2014887 RepID=UPI003D7755DA